jgi:hypothetical protein
MASTNGVISPESMAVILTNPIDICFGSMPVKSTTPAACLVIEGNAVTANQQIGTDLLTETHPPTPIDLIAGINPVEGMLSDTIKVCECVKRPRRTSSPSSMPLGLCNAAHVASRYMRRKIQIESGQKTQDRGSHRSHLDEPCPIHENPKHTTRQCRVLKKLRRPLTAAYRHQLNRETSPDHLAFQIARTTISSNYSGEELETLDREILVVSAHVPPQDGEIDEQRQESARMPMLLELFDDNKNLSPLSQAQVNNQVNNRLTPVKSMTTPVNKHLRHQLPLSSDATTINLALTDYVLETSSRTLSAMALKFTTLHKPT